MPNIGSFLTSHHVRSDSTHQVQAALRGVIKEPAFVSEAENGWVSVYCEETESQEEEPMLRIGSHLSQVLDTAVFGFLVHDSDIFCYWLFEHGKLWDEFNSQPDYFAGMDEGEDPDERARYRSRTLGRTERVSKHCKPGTTFMEVDAVLHPPAPTKNDPPNFTLPSGYPSNQSIEMFAKLLKTSAEGFREQLDLHSRQKYLFAEQQQGDLAKLLGLNEEKAGESYKGSDDDLSHLSLT